MTVEPPAWHGVGMASMTIVEFLTARLDEAETAAQAAPGRSWDWRP